MNSLLHNLARHGDISWLSYYFADFISRQAETDIDDLLCITAALVSDANQAGDVCINLERFYQLPLFHSSRIEPADIPQGIDADSWCAQLISSSCVGNPGENTPLALDGYRLYLNRFWHYETCIAAKILALHHQTNEFGSERLANIINQSDPDTASPDPDQTQAIKLAASNHFSVISGGPGTGKTTTVIKILICLLQLNPDIRIALAAPTGKAAAALMDSIGNRIDSLDLDSDTRTSIPTEASTIHRLLGYRRGSFHFDRNNRLAVDCIVVDEASMIDLTLMFHLLEALPENVRLILLGDRDQLASVAAGNVLGDITGHGHEISPHSSTLASSIVLLGRNYRFEPGSDIAELAQLVNQGHSQPAIKLLERAEGNSSWFEKSEDDIHADALTWIVSAYQPIMEAGTATEALTAYESVRVLCATNRGPLGVDSVNQLISARLLARNHLPSIELFSGLPIMILRNQHELGLYNGDTGIIWRDEVSGLRACFRMFDGGVREIAVTRLPEYGVSWATSVHKSQGSEFDSVMLILPSDPSSPVLGRELLYTAITRARKYFYLQASSATINSTIENVTRRHSALAERLGWPT